jgi:hypothetical protein
MEVPERRILWSSEDAIADEHERAAMLLEARCEEAVTRTEQETRRLIDELDGTVPHPPIQSMASSSSMDHAATVNWIEILLFAQLFFYSCFPDLCTMAGKIMPEMNRDVEEGNWKAQGATGPGRREVSHGAVGRSGEGSRLISVLT